MRQLIDTGDRACLHLFGVGSLEPLLCERIKGYERYISLGGYADPDTLVAYMRACDWLVIPSRIESIPLILIDAFQMRLPVVVTDVGDVGELVRRHGVGKVVSAEEPAALAKGMRWAMQHTKAEFEEAIEVAVREFDLARSATRCVQALCAACECRR
jgi:glycosyltransferase involved in cell wall biosynthesis